MPSNNSESPNFLKKRWSSIPVLTSQVIVKWCMTDDAWSAILTKHTQHSAEEEFALYELLDLDATPDTSQR